jgi:DNA-directed RNA polymerase subunit alpha
MNKQDVWYALHRFKSLVEYLTKQIEEFEAALSVEKDIKTGDIFKRTIDSFEWQLSVRTASVLKFNNINTIGQLVQHKEADMLKMENFGRKSLNELKEHLSQIGLGFNMYVDFLDGYVGG